MHKTDRNRELREKSTDLTKLITNKRQKFLSAAAKDVKEFFWEESSTRSKNV